MQNNTIPIINSLGTACMVLVLMTSSIGATQPPSPSKVPELTSDSHTATAGFYHLQWQKDGLSGAAYELQEATDRRFTQSVTLYQGPDQGTLISGRQDGHYYYRVRVLDQGQPASSWSAPLTVTVRHHSLTRALGFLATGATVFLATLALIVTGTQQSKRKKKLKSDVTALDN
jgi:hypothetical protein